MSQSVFSSWILAVIVLNDTTVWRNFSGYTSVAAIDFTHEGIPDLVTRRIGVLIFIFQLFADFEFTLLVEYARDVELHHSIVAEVTR